MATLYLCGAGNSEGVRLAQTVARAHSRWQSIVLLDDDANRLGCSLLGVPVVGPFERLSDANPEVDRAVNLVARTTEGRSRAGARIAGYRIPFASLIHPSVETDGVELGEGVTVYQNATLGPESTVGAGTVVFMGAVIGHEAAVGANCVLAACSVLNARVRLGDRVYVGSNATVLPEITIGAAATIGAGSSVIDDVPEGATAVGVPAMIVRGEREGQPPVSAMGPAAITAALQRLWSDVLARPEVTTKDNFFDLGGTSIQALRLRNRIESELGVALTVVDMFRLPTIERQAQQLSGVTSGDGGDALDAAKRRAEQRLAMVGRNRAGVSPGARRVAG